MSIKLADLIILTLQLPSFLDMSIANKNLIET